MQSQKPYQAYLDLGEKRYEYVESIKHEKPSPVDWIKFSYPEEDFVQLYGEQGKKQIKLKTYRHKVGQKFQKPKAVVLFFHNIGMTGIVSGHLAQDFSHQGFQTVTLDYRGHGQSEGQRGSLESADGVMKDVINFINKVKQIYREVPLFFLGDGVGCLILLNIFKDKTKLPFKGIIFAGPSFGQPKRSKVLSAISSFSLKLLPNSTGIFAFLYENYSRNLNAGKLLQENKNMYHQKVKVGTLTQLLKLSQKMDQKKTYFSMDLPELLVIQGQNDKSSDAFNTINFFEAVKCSKQMWYYKEMWHMFLIEKEYHEIKDKLVKWLTLRS